MGKTPAQILYDTNMAICANNREEMFVTVWLGILEISTGTHFDADIMKTVEEMRTELINEALSPFTNGKR